MKVWQKVIIIGAAIVAVFAGIMVYFARRAGSNEDPAYWEKEITALEEQYSSSYPQNVVVFLGSSSIRKWETLAEDMSPLPVVNHGFGGSKAADATYYVDRLITPFNPSAVVLFTGTNDINGIRGNSKSGEEVFERVVTLFERIHAESPDTPIYYISISPTAMRWRVWEDARKANELIAEYAETAENITFIDTTNAAWPWRNHRGHRPRAQPLCRPDHDPDL